MKTGAWTSQHTINGQSAAVSAWTNMPAAETFLFGSNRHVILADVSGMTYVRLKVNKQGTAGNAGAKLILRYSPTFSSSVSSYKDLGKQEVSVVIDATTAYLTSEWIEIDPSALHHEDIYLAVIGSGGNGTVDPQFGNISVSFC